MSRENYEEYRDSQIQAGRENSWFNDYVIFRKIHPELHGRERILTFLEEKSIPPSNRFYKHMIEVADKLYGK